MRVLALDASFGACSVALVVDGKPVSSLRRDDPRAATSLLPELVATLLATTPGFDVVAATVGPGSFTGIRAGLALAHGLALGATIPLVGVSTIEALLEQAAGAVSDGTAVWVAIDDHRGRCFLAKTRSAATAGLTIEVADPQAIVAPGHAVAILGDAAETVAAALAKADANVTRIPIRAIDIAQVGRIGARRVVGEVPPLPPQPWYLEPPEVRFGAAPRPAPA